VNPEWTTLNNDMMTSTWLLNNTGIDIHKILPFPFDIILTTLSILLVLAMYLAWFTNIGEFWGR
jgi:hypothetical protein